MASQEQQDALAELKKRGITVSSESVLEDKGTTFEEFKKLGESLAKGAGSGIVQILGGWGNLYDYLKKSKDPSAFSSAGISRAIRNLTGVDLQQIQGYRGAYEFGEAGAPAAALTMAGLPGLFTRTPTGIAKEGLVAGTTGVTAQAVAPDSPLAQFLLQSSPYAVKAGLQAGRSQLTAPKGTVPPETADLLAVGRMTPGEATGSRRQLATEQRVEGAASIEAKGTEFRQAQAKDVESFITQLFDRASTPNPVDPQALTDRLSTAVTNYGKALSGKLQADSRADFDKAKAKGGQIDVTNVRALVDSYANSLPTAPGLEGLRSALGRLSTELSANPTMPIGTLQDELAAWGRAAWSGEYALKGSNIFTGVAPGDVKGIARQVLRSFKTSLDNAIDANIPGAADLKKARDNFAANLDKIDEFAERPIVKTFGKPTSQLIPEEVVDKLKTMPQSQRQLLFGFVGNNAPDLANQIRRLQFDEVLGSAVNAAAAKNQPSFVIDKALEALNKKQGDFAFLFENPRDLADATRAVKYMQTILQRAEGTLDGAGASVYGMTRGVGGTAGAANLLSQVAQVTRDLLASPNAFANVIFDKDTVKSLLEFQKKSTVEKAIDFMTKAGKATAVQAMRAGPRMDVGAPVTDMSQQQAPAEPTEISPEEALRQLQMRGITME